MKTTLDLPSDLIKEMKLRAVREDKKLKDVAAEVVRLGLSVSSNPAAEGRRVRLPLIKCRKPASADRELNPEKVAAVLLQQEAEWADEASRR